MVEFAFPYRIGPDGNTASADYDRHIVHMIEQILFTRRGERRNRSDFGAGVHELIFSKSTPEVAIAAQRMIQGALQQWMTPQIEVKLVQAEAIESLIKITVRYRLVHDPDEKVLTIERSL